MKKRNNWKIIFFTITFAALTYIGFLFYSEKVWAPNEETNQTPTASPSPIASSENNAPELLSCEPTASIPSGLPLEVLQNLYKKISIEPGADSACQTKVSISDFSAECNRIDLNNDKSVEYVVSWPEICGLPVFSGASQVYPLLYVYQRNSDDSWKIILESDDAQEFEIKNNKTSGYYDIYTNSSHRDYSKEDINAQISIEETWKWSAEKQAYLPR